MRIAVVDDERPARSELKYLVEQCEPEAEIAEADGSEEFLAMLESETFDVCFVDINLAGFDDLRMIPGVGNKLAADIVALREQTGRFNRLEELTQIKGIKEKKMEKLRNYLYIDGRKANIMINSGGFVKSSAGKARKS